MSYRNRQADNSLSQTSDAMADIALNSLGLILILLVVYMMVFQSAHTSQVRHNQLLQERMQAAVSVTRKARQEALASEQRAIDSDRRAIVHQDRLADAEDKLEHQADLVDQQRQQLNAEQRRNEALRQLNQDLSAAAQDARQTAERAEQRAEAAEREARVAQGDRRQAEQTAERQRQQAEQQLQIARQQLREAKEREREFNDRQLATFEGSRLIVQVEADGVPEGLDLDVWIQDPHDQILNWMQPRQVHDDRVTGTIVPSDQLISLSGRQIEAFRTAYPVVSDTPYLVFVMLRVADGGQPTDSLPDSVTVRCRVTLPMSSSSIELTKTISINGAGQVYKQGVDGLMVSGLHPAAAFRLQSLGNVLRSSESTCPGSLRGWNDIVNPDFSKPIILR